MLNKIIQFSLIGATVVSLLTGSNQTITVKADNLNGVVEERYSTVFSNWGKDGVKSPLNFKEVIVANQLQHSGTVQDVTKSHGYYDEVVHVKENDTYRLEINVEEEGLYELSLDYFPLSEGVKSVEASFKINGVYPYYEARRIVFSKLWRNEVAEFPIDNKGNEVAPSQVHEPKWQTMFLTDASHLQVGNLKIYLQAGTNVIEFEQTSGEMLIGNISIQSEEVIPTYSSYLNQYKNQELVDSKLMLLEAEHNRYKNNIGIIQNVSRDLEAMPYDVYKKRMNTFGGDSWAKAGQTVYYEVDVLESGMYQLAFKVKQNYKAKDNVFRTISIDHEVPFEEAKSFKFPFSNDWQTVVFGSESPYLIYLEKGKHVIGLEVDNDPYVDLVNIIQDIMKDINDLSLQIKRLVGGNTDQYRDWVIVDYIPDIEERLSSMAERLKVEYKRYTESGYNERAQIFSTMKRVIDVFEALGQDPNELPKKLSVLSEGSGSTLQTLSDLIIEIQRQPLLMDQLYVYTDEEELPNYDVSLTTKMTHSAKRFVHSFVPKEKDEVIENEIVLDVWVNRGRYYVDLLQKHIDSDFTPKTGIKVNLSLMPSEQKLILANSSGVQPDIALGVSSGIPYEFAVRNAALDLRQFEDFDTYSKQFTPGALMRYVIDESVYAMPETQDFNVIFYRTDILGSLGIDVPETWNEVIEILPELQRNGMNFYSPLGSASGYKSFATTAPFIYQFGGNIYHANGMETALNSKESLEGIKMMTDLFGIYGLPLQVPNFYNHFRSGILPIGIGNFSDYLRLKYAAPELEGSWAIAPHPGVENEDGTIERWASGAGQASMIFSKTKYPEESWDFMKWWMSTDVQVKYANELQMIYGEEFVWNSANIEAFMSLPWDTDDKKIISKQWEWLIEVPNIPGGYMAERELSNAWNKIIFDDENPRSAIDDAINIVNREIKRKLEEFGYTINGELIKPYEVPTIEKIESWVNE